MAVIKKSRFTLKDVSEHFFRNSSDNNRALIPILDTLFQCSAIGNVKHIRERIYFSFKYRNRHSHFNPEDEIVVHRGLLKGMNII
jgi:hypothetical protein